MTSCEQVQSALSAEADGEETGIDPALLTRHLAGCTTCREFGRALRGRMLGAHLAEAPDMPDLSRQVARRAAVADRASAQWFVRVLLAAVAVEMIVAAVPALVLGHDGAFASHEARHLGAFSVAIAVGLLVVVVRPARARAMLPVAMVLVGALAITAVVDLIDGDAEVLAEAAHLPGFLSVVCVWLLARRPLRAGSGPSVTERAPLRVVDELDPRSEAG